MKEKRVVLAVTNDLQGDQRVHKVAMTLQSHGWKPVLVGRKLPGSGALSRPYPVYRFHIWFRRGPLLYLSYNLRLLLYLLAHRAECFTANDLDTLPAVYLAGRIMHIPVVYDSHEYFTEVPELVDRPRTQKIWKWIEKRIFPHLEQVMTVNHSIARIYEEQYGIPVRVVRNLPRQSGLLHDDPLLQDADPNHPVLIYQGAINVGRGLEEILRTMPLLPDVSLLIVGDGDILERLRSWVCEMKLDDQVTFTGRVPFEDLHRYTRQATIGLSLEQNMGLNYYYALPNKLFDYMHYGLPVIASDLPEIRAVVETVNFGVLTDRFEPEHLAGIIRKVLANPEQLKQWADNARRAATNYTWAHEEAELMALYR